MLPGRRSLRSGDAAQTVGRLSSDRGHGIEQLYNNSLIARLLGQAVTHSELGWPLVIAGALGLALMIRLEVTRSSALSWLLFASLLIGLFIGKPFQPFRNLLPLVLLFCIAAAIAFAQLFRWTGFSRYRKLAYIGASLLILATIGSLCASSLKTLRSRALHRDTRVRTIDWLRRHTLKSDRVLALAELGFLPSEWDRSDASVRVAPWSGALDLLRRNQFD